MTLHSSLHDGTTLRLRKPSLALLPAYRDALARGWTPDDFDPERRTALLDLTEHSPEVFLLREDDPKALGGLVILPNGRLAPRLPRTMRWIWQDDAFCGVVGLRWWRGHGNGLPAHVLGHLSYSVVPWRRREGLATAAVQMLLPKARAIGLTALDAVILPDNLASIRVIERAGGRLVDRFRLDAHHDRIPALRYRLSLRETARQE